MKPRYKGTKNSFLFNSCNDLFRTFKEVIFK